MPLHRIPFTELGEAESILFPSCMQPLPVSLRRQAVQIIKYATIISHRGIVSFLPFLSSRTFGNNEANYCARKDAILPDMKLYQDFPSSQQTFAIRCYPVTTKSMLQVYLASSLSELPSCIIVHLRKRDIKTHRLFPALFSMQTPLSPTLPCTLRLTVISVRILPSFVQPIQN